MKKTTTCLILFGLAFFTNCEEESDPFINNITVSPQTATVEVGGQQQFTTTLTDENGDSISGDVIWSVGDSALASIDENGLASGIKEGSVLITATASGNKTGNATLTIGVGAIIFSNISNSVIMIPGDILNLTVLYVNLLGDTLVNPEITWSSSNENVLTVSSLGLVTAVSNGNATVTATHETGSSGFLEIAVEDIESFNITRVDVESLGDSDQSQPELVRFINATEGVVVNSRQNTLDFFTITSTNLSISGESIQITDDPDAECSSIDVSVDETIIAVNVTKGACDRGLLYLVDANTRIKYGPYELGYNPDAVDIAVDNQFVVSVNEFDYEDGVSGGCDTLGYPGVTIYDISSGLNYATLVRDMKISGSGLNGNLREPEGVKIAPDGETVYMTLQESNELGWFSITSPPETLENIISFNSAEHEPDGIWINSDGSVLCTGGEYDGQLGVLVLDAEGIPVEQHYINLASDLPSTWDWDDRRKGIEPEEVVIVEAGLQTFVMATLQDPGSVVVYNITDPQNPFYDSGVITELNDYTTITDGSSQGEPEGLAFKDGYILVSNTGDPSVCLLKASWAE